MKRTILMFMALTLFLACSKKEDIKSPQVQPPNIDQLLSIGDSWEEAENSTNPADSAGLQHNLILSAILSELHPSKLSIDSIYPKACSLSTSFYGSNVTTVFTSNITTNVAELILNDLMDSTFDPQNFATNVCSLSVTSSIYIATLLDSTFSLDDEITDFDDIKAIIVAWENGISSLSVSESEKARLYQFGSIFRYSTNGWYYCTEDTDGKIVFKTTRPPRWLRWVIVGACDAFAGITAGTVGTLAAGIVTGALISAGAAGVLFQ